MNKGGGVGAGGGGGPTAAASAAAAQKQKNLLQRVDNDIANIVDNFSYLVNVARVNDPPVRNSQEAFMMEMRAARTVQAADSLLKLVSELKQTAIFSGFSSLSEHVEQRTNEFNQQAEKTDCMLSRIGEEAAGSLKELETHYYSSCQKTNNIELLMPESVLAAPKEKKLTGGQWFESGRAAGKRASAIAEGSEDEDEEDIDLDDSDFEDDEEDMLEHYLAEK